MSQIGSVGSVNSTLYQYLVQLAEQSDETGAAESSNSTDAANSASTTSTADGSSAGSSASSALADLRSQLETAVTNAISGLDPSVSPSDAIQVIGSAISQTLQANGIGPQQGPGNPQQDTLIAALGTGNDISSQASLFDALTSSSDGSSSDSSDQQNSLLAALTSGNGNVDLSSLFQSLFANFPNGSGVDVLA